MQHNPSYFIASKTFVNSKANLDFHFYLEFNVKNILINSNNETIPIKVSYITFCKNG